MKKFIKPYLLTGVAILSMNSSYANNNNTVISKESKQSQLNEQSSLVLQNNKDILINKSGIYSFSGDVTNSSIIIEAGEKDTVNIILDSVTITNQNTPAIYVKSADKVYITTNNKNSLAVTKEYIPDGDTNLDAVIFSRSDLSLDGLGSLNISGTTGNGISSKDDLIVAGGYITINALKDGLEANDSIQIIGGDIAIRAGADALHSEGYIHIEKGDLELNAADDAIRGTTYILIDGGTIDIPNCKEGIEATEIEINGGKITINSSDDGINATAKSEGEVKITVNGGDILINMADGDTDGFDSNGDLYINGGKIEVNARSAFDADGTAELKNVSVIVNGEILNELPITRGGFRKKRK
ncbi:MAG: carbohydrate-binding domain-containing protein [Spirochaetaceae bacterium]